MIKRTLLLLCSAFLPLLLSAQQAADKIAPDLMQRMTDAPADLQGAVLILADQEDTRAMLLDFETRNVSMEERSYEVITRLQNKANSTQPAVMAQIRNTPGVNQNSAYPVWIINAIYVQANASAILRLAELPEIGEIQWGDAPLSIDPPVARTQAASSPNGSEVGLKAIKANFMWNLGYTGYGRKALVIDTGEDGDHPALLSNFWGHNVDTDEAWHGTGYPEDCSNHGSHVTGTVCGLDRKTNDTIGVAFNAKWMGGPMQFPIGPTEGCQRNFTQSIFSNTSSMQWAINPDGNANTITDRPDVINCSWRGSPFDCGNSQATTVLNAVEAAGIAVVWSQGNDGPAASTVASGAAMNMDLVNTFAVGAVNGANGAFPIAAFSSRGPTPCGGSGALLIKPEVCAPGVQVRSSVTGGGYDNFDGTSMASPHASGALLLLKEAFPTLSGIQLKMALYNSATDLGAAGEDNAYGKGMINLQSAYNYLIGQGHVPVPPVAATHDVIMIDVQVSGKCIGPVGATATFKNSMPVAVSSLDFEYGLDGGTVNTYSWTGTLAPGAFTTVTLPMISDVQPGDHEYRVKIKNPNGVADERELNNVFKRPFTMDNDDYSTAQVNAQQALPVCTNSRVLLEYTGTPAPAEKVLWYTTSTVPNSVAQGNTYLTPPLNQNSTYYVSTSAFYNIGKSELPNANNGSSIEGALLFNASEDFILRSVKIYAPAAGTRTVRLRDNAGNSLGQKFVAVSQPGEQRVALNFTVPKGSGYQLILEAGNPLYHTTVSPGYPHNVAGVASIFAGQTASGSSTPFFYYYFFDWEIEVPQFCGRTAVPIQVGGNASPTVAIASPDTVYLSQGGTITFTDNTVGSSSRNWNFGNGNVGTDISASTTYTTVGNYTVLLQVTSANGCVNYGQKTIVVLQQPVSSVLTPDFDPGSVFLYPNPTSSEINLGFVNDLPRSVEIILLDPLGRSTRFEPGALASGSQYTIKTAHLPAGMYFVQVRTEGRLYWAGRFVKE